MPIRTPAALDGARRAVTAMPAGQRVVAVLAAAALVLGGTAFVRWASAPTLVPLFTNLAASDASAIVDQLDAEGVPYELASGGASVLVPQEDVYRLRLRLSADGLPEAEETGYALLDAQGVTASQFQQQVTYQRAMEGELARTIGAIDGVESAVVHLAIPQDDVFLTETAPPTASVLVRTRPGADVERDQVEAVVNLVASAVEGMAPEDVTVVDGDGRLLSTDTLAGGAGGGGRDEATSDYEGRVRIGLQAMLDQVLGKGAAVATVTAQLDLDATDTTSERFVTEEGVPPLSQSTTSETYEGTGGAAGVLGPDNIAVPNGATDGGSYAKESTTQDNAVGKVVEKRVGAPGDVVKQSVAVVVDTGRAGAVDVAQLTEMVNAAAGIDAARGDTVSVTRMPFDTSAAETAAAAGEQAAAAAEAEARGAMLRTALLAAVVLLLLVVAAIGAVVRRRRREDAMDVVQELPWERVEDPALTAVGAAGQNALGAAGAAPALPAASDPASRARADIEALVERQPDEVAELLRGWLADRRS
jgi:flagellar M-ring protein FliF